jgi:hypothetical protein
MANRLFDQRLDRDDTLRGCYSEFNSLLTTYDSYFDSGCTTPLRVPIIALTAAPGSGKTFFIDELGELNPDDIVSFCSIESRHEDFKSALVLKVSYNSTCIVAVPEDRDHVGLCARILWGFALVCDAFI